MPVHTERIRLNKRAHQKPLTWNPLTSFSAKMIINALIAKRKSPSVTTVIGIVRMVKIGFTMVFKNASTTATISADK